VFCSAGRDGGQEVNMPRVVLAATGTESDSRMAVSTAAGVSLTNGEEVVTTEGLGGGFFS
jgi:hypothetical protein